MASLITPAQPSPRATSSFPRHLNRGDAVKRVSLSVCLLILTAGCAAKSKPDVAVSPEVRRDALARARVWHSVPTASLDIARGPGGKGAFAPNALVDCHYVERDMGGNTPKFACRLANGNEVKVKYGRDNGEVYAEVAASRLLWALGFSADAMYPVRVRCHGCPGAKPGGAPVMFDPATIERRVSGSSLADEGGEGWSWPELDAIAPRGALSTHAQRDALKLLAAMLQHTDSKREQQSLICEVKVRSGGRCPQPLAYVADLGKTFGKVNLLNRDVPGSVDLDAWSATPVWSGTTGCQANAGTTMTGTLKDPEISDAGRQLLLKLLQQLSDAQVRDLFRVSRFPIRESDVAGREAATVDRWVAAFHQKRTENRQPPLRDDESSAMSRRAWFATAALLGLGFCVLTMPATAQALPDAAAAATAAPTALPAEPPAAWDEAFRALTRLPLAALLASILALRPRRRGTPPRDLAVIHSQIILAVVGVLVMLVVGTSLARAFGIVGAAGLVRYRAKVNDPKDAGVMLSTLAIGLATGVGQWPLAIVGTVFLLVLLEVIESFEPAATRELVIAVKTSAPMVVKPRLERLLRRQAARFEIKAMSAEELQYDVQWPVDQPTDGLSERIAGMDPKNSVDVSIEQSKGK